MKIKLFILSFFVVVPSLVSSISAQTPPPNPTVQQMADANTKFALNLYDLYKNKNENVFFSPYSITTALGMTYEGAKGETASQIQKVFGFISDVKERHDGFLALMSEINKKDKQYQLATANALWVQKGFELLPNYTEAIEKYFGGMMTNLDFMNDGENARITINTWVEKQTNHKIKDLIPPPMSAAMRVILTNAVYFFGNWEKQFDPTLTQPQKFWTSNTTSVMTPMMSFADNPVHMGYTETPTLQALNIPYKGRDLSMLILLPKSKEVSGLDQELTVDLIKQCQLNTKFAGKVIVSIPKFKIEATYMLAEDLKTLGMPLAFQFPDADFSGIDGSKKLFISNVIHKSFVEVNETGTEAAAATAVIMNAGAAPGKHKEPPLFVADHPFIFIIQQQSTGNILFMGKVMKP